MDALDRLRKRKRLVKDAEVTILLKRALRPKRKPNIGIIIMEVFRDVA